MNEITRFLIIVGAQFALFYSAYNYGKYDANKRWAKSNSLNFREDNQIKYSVDLVNGEWQITEFKKKVVKR